ncbi:MAG: DUF3108 domain-containing protein [Verrucomicrobia bacterium]|nr:DUF3108 domain-containing protein [Verrucomicrobiota bacterium]
MKVAASIVAALVAVTASAQDWRERLSPAEPGPFPLPRPLHASYRFGWGVFTAATAQGGLSWTDTRLLRLDAKGKTVGAVRLLWRMDAEVTALCQPTTLRPVSDAFTEVYRGETRKTKVDYDDAGATRTRWTQGDERVKTKRFDSPDLFDLPTALLWMRSQRLGAGDTHRCVIFPDSSAYVTEMEVAGRERIAVAGKRYDAIKVALRLREVNRKRELVPHDKFKRAFGWLSDDNDRLLLKVVAEVFIGSVWMELTKVEFDREKAAGRISVSGQVQETDLEARSTSHASDP